MKRPRLPAHPNRSFKDAVNLMGEAVCGHDCTCSVPAGRQVGPHRARFVLRPAWRAHAVVALIGLLPASAFAQSGPHHSVLDAYDLREKDPLQFDLGRPLREISGLAIDGAGHLFAHQDERGVVFEIDPTTGRTVRTFRLGRNGVRGDFEGIAVAGPDMYLISSEGTLVRFRAGADDATVEYERLATGSRSWCREVEGLDFDARTGDLLIACKFTAGRERRERLVVLAYSIRARALHAEPRLSIPLNALEPFGVDKGLSPSGVAIHPVSGTIFVIAARENALVEISPDGRILAAITLRGRTHHQPEGIAFAPDGTLYIADEGRSGRATLTVYPPDPARLR